jgi:hypothetical protein
MSEERQQPPWWRTPIGLVTCGFIVVVGFFLLREHTAHLFGVLRLSADAPFHAPWPSRRPWRSRADVGLEPGR